MKGFSKVSRSGHSVAAAHAQRKRSASCTNGGFYKSPTAGEAIPYTTPVNITWDTSCLNSTAVDIYLIAPGTALPRIHEWTNVDFVSGSYNTTLMPKWWNSTSQVNLQLSIVPAGMPSFTSTMPAGPVFIATYKPPTSGAIPAAADTSSPGSGITNVNNVPKKTGPSKGAIAAGVLLPLLFLIGLGVAVYIRLSRAKGKDKRKRWSEAVDKRMSTIATEWRPVSTAGAVEAVRKSVFINANAGDRASTFSFSANRPSSTVAVEGQDSSVDLSAPHMAQLRPGVRASAFGERVSRVSFAPDTRPSGEHRRTRAFHTSHVPPLPESEESGVMSPTQAEGPVTLSADDIRNRLSIMETSRPSFDGVLPALSMMRTGGEDAEGNDEMLIPPAPQLPTPPAPAHQIPKSSIVGIMPMQPMPANFMSPDDMLRAYAEARAMGSPTPASSAPAANYNGNGMRILYSPTAPEPAAPPAAIPRQSTYTPRGIQELVRKSVAVTLGSHYDVEEEDDAYGAYEAYEGVEPGVAE